jgi:hypothetical protein
MKVSAVLALTAVGSASAFTAPLATRAISKPVAKAAPVKPVAKAAPAKPVAKAAPAKPVVAKAAPVKKVVAKAAPAKKVVAKAAPAASSDKASQYTVRDSSLFTNPSTALPWAKAPVTLEGYLGDAGFDPLGFSTKKNAFLFKDVQGIRWLREAEIIHGRIAQVAALGFVAPGLFGTFPGNAEVGFDAYSNVNPLEALGQVPSAALLQIFLFMSYLEVRRINIIQEEGSNYVLGDSRFGQGDKRWNPFGFDYTPEEYEVKQLQELNHGRAAMLGVFGLWAQCAKSGLGITEQLGAALTAPDYYAKAGYFLPEGI